jgi:hypothetical protein
MHATIRTKRDSLTRPATIGITRSRIAATMMTALTAAGALAAGNQAAIAATAPACIVRGARGPGHIQIINKCSRKERVQVKVKFGQDTGCTTIEVGEQFWFAWPLGGYRKTSVC